MIFRPVAILSGMLAPLASAVVAQDWEYELRPYLWVPSFQAELAFGGNPPSEGERSFWDVFEGAFLLQGAARQGDHAILGEFNYLKLGDTVLPSVPVLATDAGLEGIMVSAAYARTLSGNGRSLVELYGGARYWDLEFTAANPVFGGARIRKHWVDPIIGLRAEYALTGRARLTGGANIGGFGLGSDFQADLQAAVDWQVGQATRLGLGYRYVHVDFDDQGVVADFTINGPFVDLTFRF